VPSGTRAVETAPALTGATTPGSRPAAPRLAEAAVVRIAERNPKIAEWLRSYPRHTGYASYSGASGTWLVHIDDARANGAGEVAQAEVTDADGRVVHAWTGPQVAWPSMARGYWGTFGRRINDPTIWLALCGIFLVCLVDWRRWRSLRNLDLLVLLSLSVSLVYFNQGRIFWSVPLAYPPLLYLLARMLSIGFRSRDRPAWSGTLPIWLMAGLAVFLIGFRLGLNAYNSNVIDVGYAGVIGADRVMRGQLPYGTFPDNAGKACGLPTADGGSTAYRQPDGRCEAPNAQGDTYGPVNYLAYVPALAVSGWDGTCCSLPAAHGTSALFDLLCAGGLLAAGWRLAGRRLGLALALAWTAFPFTSYALESNSNDMIAAAIMVWGFVAATSPAGRGALLALAGWAKFAPLVAIPLWARYPRGAARSAEVWRFGEPEAALAPGGAAARTPANPRRGLALYAVGVLAATLAAGLVLVPGGTHALRTFWERTFGWQLSRPSPFSIWKWGNDGPGSGAWAYPGFPDLGWLQSLLKGALLAGALLLAFLPRRLDAVRLAALTAALLIGFEIVLTHWSYLYIPWFLPFALIALCAPSRST
jgi:hypothetical protein